MSLAGIPADVWQLILQHLEILAVCMFGSASRAAASQAFSCEQMWTLVRLPRKSEAHVLGILRLGASLGAPLVQHLDATATPFLEDASLFAAAALMPLLQRINLNGCRRVQSATVALAQTCPRLTAMQCAGCPRLSDREIVGITHHAASRLVHLDLSSCSSRVGDVTWVVHCPPRTAAFQLQAAHRFRRHFYVCWRGAPCQRSGWRTGCGEWRRWWRWD